MAPLDRLLFPQVEGMSLPWWVSCSRMVGVRGSDAARVEVSGVIVEQAERGGMLQEGPI